MDTNKKSDAKYRRIVEAYTPSEGCPPLSAHIAVAGPDRAQWLERFALAIQDEPTRDDAWFRLEQVVGEMSQVIELLYLFTVRAETLVDRNAKSHRSSKARFRKVIAGLDGVMKRFDGVRPLHNPGYRHAAAALASLRQDLEALGREDADWGSGKTDAKDWYLYLLATSILKTGRFTKTKTFDYITALVDAARSAHGEQRETFTAEVLEKRVERYHLRLTKRLQYGREFDDSAESETRRRLLKLTDEDLPF